jgi:NADH-quinone oxidoreductase subunit L
MSMLQHALFILVLPLVSAAVIALFLRKAGGIASLVSTLTAAIIAVVSVILAIHGERFEASFEWLRIGTFVVSIGIKFDDLAALMLVIVGLVGLCVHVFSLGYMHEDDAKARYFGGLSIFMFSMLGIVFADNLFMMFIFWELVGFSSYVLINHFHFKQTAADASKKAFIANRVGDFGFLLGIVMCFWLNGTVNLTELATKSGAHTLVFSTAIPLLLFCGAVGKSAQLPLHVWLPDAMEGPTPVSALIHAATMVAAGIYMLCRIHVLMVPDALTVITWVGTITALYAALCAITQSDIKKVLAYSTLSQLGYMVAAFGLGGAGGLIAGGKEVGNAGGDLVHGAVLLAGSAGIGAAMFHLTTHAFFKALMFLGSGSVIHGCHHEQDIFKMGGLKKKMPLTFITFTIGVLAIIGFPYLAGFFSKDAILFLAFANNKAVFALLALTAVLTSLYMVRLWKLVFLGTPRSDEASHAHEGGLTLTLPLVFLAILSVLGGYTGIYPKVFNGVFELIPEAHGSAHTIIFITSVAVMVLGASIGYFYYQSSSTDTLAQKSPGLFTALTALKQFFDRVYDYYVAKIQQRFALLVNLFEQLVLAGAIIRGLGLLTGFFGMGARVLHVGKLNAYVYWFLLGLVALWLFATGVVTL